MGRADAEIEIADRRRLGRDDVNVDGELVGMEAERLLDALQAVERVEGGERMQDHAAHRLIESRPATSKLSMSDFSILRPPMTTSSLATGLPRPPAAKPTRRLSQFENG